MNIARGFAVALSQEDQTPLGAKVLGHMVLNFNASRVGKCGTGTVSFGDLGELDGTFFDFGDQQIYFNPDNREISLKAAVGEVIACEFDSMAGRDPCILKTETQAILPDALIDTIVHPKLEPFEINMFADAFSETAPDQKSHF